MAEERLPSSEERSYQRDMLRSWMKERFDKIDEDNEKIKTDVDTVKEQVLRHGIYWDIVKYSVISAGGIAATVGGWLGLHQK